MNPSFDEFLGEENGIVVDTIELFKDISVDLGVEVNCFDGGGSIGYVCGRREYFARSTLVSYWLARRDGDDADVLYKPGLK